ncbi:hypothetical protein SAMN05216436_107130 [bacterium A37T11]|nr:hypothetical protein SAMN05216436_107130 [bacterium A37T11]
MQRLLFIPALATLLMAGCGGGSKNRAVNSQDTDVNNSQPTVASTEQKSGRLFDVASVKVSEKISGAFPYIQLPAGIIPLNKPLLRDYDELYFPVGDSLVLIKGKAYKTFVTDSGDREWSAPYFLRQLEESITAKGGVKMFDGKLRKDQVAYFQEHAQYAGEEGSIDYANEPVRSYVIRKPDSTLVYIQFYGYSAGGSVQVVEEGK